MKSNPESVLFRRRTRPVRFLFLVEPDDVDAILKSVQLSVTMWGGIHNKIVPAFRKRPPFFPDRDVPTCKEIVQGYVTNSEPDYVVESVKGLAKRYGVDSNIRGLADFERYISRNYVSMAAIYELLHQKKYQFVQRDPEKSILLSSPDDLFLSVCFGSFSSTVTGNKLRDEYLRVFSPQLFQKPFDFLSIQTAKCQTPLSLTSFRLRRTRTGNVRGFREKGFFLLNAKSHSDVLEFWNLRAQGWMLFPLPIEFVDSLQTDYSDAIQETFDPFLEEITVVAASSIDPQFALRFCSEITNLIGKRARKISIPRMWSPVWHETECGRTEVFSTEEFIRSTSSAGKYAVTIEPPPFLSEVLNKLVTCQFATTFEVVDTGYNQELATVYPERLLEVKELLHDTTFLGIRTTSEGFSVLSDNQSYKLSWLLPNGQDVLNVWFSQQGYRVRVDSNGKAVNQLIRTFGNLFELRSIQSPDVLKLLEKMSLSENGCSTQGEWKAALRRANKNDVKAAQEQMKTLLDCGALKTGLAVKCLTCEYENWYAPTELMLEMACSRCKERVYFPSPEPPQPEQWKFRAHGVFNIKDYVRGGYAVALALRFFACSLNGSATWSPSFKIVGSDEKEIDVDFGLFWRRAGSWSGHEMLVLGECKSFGDFSSKDFQRSRKLFKRFPLAIQVLATLKSELTARELKHIREIATKVKSFSVAGEARAGLIVLTGKELFSGRKFPECLEDPKISLAEIDRKYKKTGDDLIDACLTTQQLHLNLPNPIK